MSSSKNISEEERKQIIAHEKVHIRQWHSIDILLLEFMRMLFWINPAVWFLRKSQAENHEFIADETVLRFHDSLQYQQLLIKMTVDQIQLVGNYFAKIQTLKRINMMNKRRRKPNGLKLAMALICSLLIVIALACNDELVDVVQSAEMVLELPPEVQKEMEELTEHYPDEKFVYVEVDRPENGTDFKNTLMNNGIDEKTIQSVFTIDERTKMGLILSTTENFHKAAEFTKDIDSEGDEVFDIVEDQPKPREGMKAFYKYIATNMRYPTEAKNKGIEGRVFIQFVVDEVGNLTKITPVKGIGAGCDEEAMRVLENAPQWKPGFQRGIAVKTRMILPITFSLGGSNTVLSDDEKNRKEQERVVELKSRLQTVEGRQVQE